MENFLQELGEINPSTGKYYLSNVRSGLIVNMVSFSQHVFCDHPSSQTLLAVHWDSCRSPRCGTHIKPNWKEVLNLFIVRHVLRRAHRSDGNAGWEMASDCGGEVGCGLRRRSPLYFGAPFPERNCSVPYQRFNCVVRHKPAIQQPAIQQADQLAVLINCSLSSVFWLPTSSITARTPSRAEPHGK